jgi:hypothetical protein
MCMWKKVRDLFFFPSISLFHDFATGILMWSQMPTILLALWVLVSLLAEGPNFFSPKIPIV